MIISYVTTNEISKIKYTICKQIYIYITYKIPILHYYRNKVILTEK